jgi:outer membrane protein TolC
MGAVLIPSSVHSMPIRDLFQAQLDLAEIRLNELLSVVRLCKALGGGWQ